MEKSNCEWRRGNSEGRGTDGEEKREEGDEREVGQERITEKNDMEEERRDLNKGNR